MERTLAEARARLVDMDPVVRHQALEELVAAAGDTQSTSREAVNMHCHTFYSFNGYGHSPSSLAWLAREQGWYALGTVDFDVLDAVDETLTAGDRVGVRAAAGLETRAYVAEFGSQEINSPGEPGVCYFVGLGFTSANAPAQAQRTLRQMRTGAERRNREQVARINAHLAPVAIDYDRDVRPLTPSGNATERHMLVAYDAAARRAWRRREALVSFWAERLDLDEGVVEASLGPEPTPNDLIRGRLMKAGGVGYVPPTPDTFPPIDQVIAAIVACGAVPVCAWLDGASEGERRMEELLALLIAKGVGAVNIIPERNWNYADPIVRQAKVAALHAFVDLARAMDLPVITGTEMNKAGQPVMDDLNVEALRPLREDAIRGAEFIYGHTALARTLGIGYQSAWARRHLPARSERNAFYAEAGRRLAPGPRCLERLPRLGDDDSPAALLRALT